MPNPACQVKDGAGAFGPTTNGVDVADDGLVVTIKLADVSGVDVWSPTISGSDDLVAVPALTIDNVAKTATFTKPAGPWSFIVQSVVNSGKDINGKTQTSYTTTFKISVLATGGLRLLASNERSEGSTAFGWIKVFNALVRIVAAALAVTTNNDSWQTGTDGNDTITGTAGCQVRFTPAAFTAPRTWSFPTAPTDGMKAGVYDGNRILVNAGNTLTLSGGTKHIFVNGVDKGTTWVVDADLFKGSTALFRYRASDTTWHLA